MYIDGMMDMDGYIVYRCIDIHVFMEGWLDVSICKDRNGWMNEWIDTYRCINRYGWIWIYMDV